MRKLKTAGFFALCALFSFVLFAKESQSASSLIKGEGSSVYYLSSDGKRYIFPNEKIYFSWFSDFSGVTKLTNSDLAKIPLGKNITYRPGTRLVKLASVPKVYAVETGGILRWIPSETVAYNLYGGDWAKKVDDMSDSFFSDYIFGKDLASGIYPEGSVVIDESSSKKYVIWGGQKRELQGTAFEKNKFLDKFTAYASSLSQYIIGTPVINEESYFTDASELHGTAKSTEQVSIIALPTSASAFAGEKSAVLGAFALQTKQAITVSQLRATIESKSFSRDSDADLGGLVFGGNSDDDQRANLTNLRFSLFGKNGFLSTGALNAAESDDDKQTLSFTGSESLAAGRHILFFTADIDEYTPNDEQYGISLNTSASVISGWDATGKKDMYGSGIMIVSGELEISSCGGIEKQTIFENEIKIFDASCFRFEANGIDEATIKELAITAYVDEGEGNADFLPGEDSDNGSFLRAENLISSVSLINKATGLSYGTKTISSSDGRILFSGLNIKIVQGSPLELVLRATTSGNTPDELGTDRISFDIAVAEDDVSAFASDGAEIDAQGDEPNGGITPKVYHSFISHGTISITGGSAGEGYVYMGQQDAVSYAVRFRPSKEEDFIVEGMTFRILTPESKRSIKRAYIKYTDAQGVVSESSTGFGSSDTANFSGLSIPLPKDKNTDIGLMLEISGSLFGATSGDEIAVVFETAGSFRLRGARSNAVFDTDDVGSDVSASIVQGEALTVRKNIPVFSPANSVLVSGSDELLGFSVSSKGEGVPEIKRLTFKITSTDVGTVGSDNDLFERWADVNGDYLDDDDIIDLYEIENQQPLAENGSGSIDFSIYDASSHAIDSTPQGIDTASGDYGLITIDFTTTLKAYAPSKTYLLVADVLSKIAGDGYSVRATLQTDSTQIAENLIWSDGTGLGSSLSGQFISGLPIKGIEWRN
ncbi:MAG: hypothetical protein ACD_76C00046G0002 [uncultured bacterium]|nr:MAG: hypothetical protein ACD_76C00046G0002 [uncultured bacterium]